MPKIHIDGIPYVVEEGQNLLHVALSLGLDLPYFCWHPALGSVGACRQCAVKQYKDEHDQQGKIVMACMTPASEGTRISMQDPESKGFRATVIEWLMTNHPHDCPVCDEGGECHLQDMTVMTGHNYRRFRFPKRTFRNQNLGPFINHEMNRCITCYRCVRFYRDYAGGKDLDSFAANNHVYFGRAEDGTLESEFSGNLVEVCPTGVFTDKTLKRHYTRKWDLQNAPSVCTGCGLGCNILAGERYGKLRRILNRYNRQVNGYFLCDRGRFGYEYVNSSSRFRKPHVRKNGRLEEVSAEEALRQVATLLSRSDNVIGIGSPRASMESNFSLRALVGEDRFFNGMSANESGLVSSIINILKSGPARSASLRDVECADAVLILGEDLTNTAPMLALAAHQSVRHEPMEIARSMGIADWNDAAVREAVQQKKGPLFVITPAATKLDTIATKTVRGAPDDIARLGFAVAAILSNRAPKVSGTAGVTLDLAKEIAHALKEARKPLIIAGTSLNSKAIIEAAANVAWALCDQERTAGICYTVPEANSLGVGFFQAEGIDAAFSMAQRDQVETAIILGNDVYRRAPRKAVEKFFSTIKHVVVFDHLPTPTTEKAEIILPSGTFAESTGTMINNEGRAQRFFKVFVPQGDIRDNWRWIGKRNGAGGAQVWHDFDDVSDAMFRTLSSLHVDSTVAPGADFKIVGKKIPRQTHRFSGRTAMNANKNVSEQKPPDDPDSALAFSMEGSREQPPASLTPYFWAAGWNSVQSTNKYQTRVDGPMRGGDAGVRVIEAKERTTPEFFTSIPPPFSARKSEVLVVPLYHIFGSEELTSRSESIAQRMPVPHLAINEEGASALEIGNDSGITIIIGDAQYELPATIGKEIPKGVVGFPVGLPGMDWVDLPSWGTIGKGNA